MPVSHFIQPTQQSQVATKGQPQQSRGQPTSFLIVHDQQAGPSRPITFTLTLTKHFNPPSVASATGKESQHNISGLSSFFGNIPSVLSYQQIDTLQPFLPVDMQSPATSPPRLTAKTSAATSPASASSAVTPGQTAATVEPLAILNFKISCKFASK